MVRRQFARKYRLSPIFYAVTADPETDREAHAALSTILLDLATLAPGVPTPANPPANASIASATGDGETVAQRAMREFRSNLFETGQGTPLYVEPRLTRPTTPADDGTVVEGDSASVDDIVGSTLSFVITAPSEYGSTTLAKRIVAELNAIGTDAFYREAPSLPNYKKKLLQDSMFVRTTSNLRVLVLDDFDIAANERLLSEIVSLKAFDRYVILLNRLNSGFVSPLDLSSFGIAFESLILKGLSRSDIRTIAGQMYDTGDEFLISAAVDKSYTDLLELCIPLTPSNVIMYLSIIHKEGDFFPLSRLQIIERYIHDLLRKPSDAYQDSFNAKNKIDVVSAFVYDLHRRLATHCTSGDWHRFCKCLSGELLNRMNQL